MFYTIVPCKSLFLSNIIECDFNFFLVYHFLEYQLHISSSNVNQSCFGRTSHCVTAAYIICLSDRKTDRIENGSSRNEALAKF